MTKRIIHCLPDAEQVYVSAAESLVTIGAAAIERRGRFFVALSGGTTPGPLYQLLTRSEFRNQIDWSSVEWFWSDERAVPPDHQDSNYRMASDALLLPLEVEPKCIHRMPAERSDLDAAACAYEHEIADTFRVSLSYPPPRFDLILLGMGDDGHTASLFPYTAALNADDQWVVANDVPQLKTRRMTMTSKFINRAHHVFFLVTGEGKASRLAEVIEGTRDTQRLPSQLICPDRGSVEWYVDAAGAGQLGALP